MSRRVTVGMPFTWFVQLPEVAGFHEATRFGMLGLLPTALLAGAAVDWPHARARARGPGGAVGVLEAGWGGQCPRGVWAVLATADGHPRAIAYPSRIPGPALTAIGTNTFYVGLLKAQDQVAAAPRPTAARLNARRMNVGWVIVRQQALA